MNQAAAARVAGALADGACTGCRSTEARMADSKRYDVLIIGSGASGGMAAYTLTEEGHQVPDAGRGTRGRFRTPARKQAGL